MHARLTAVVLAAGEGTRMRSDRPKPLHRLCGRPMLFYALDALAACRVDAAVVVVGHGSERVVKVLQEHTDPLVLGFVEQDVLRGTGDATAVGLTGLPDSLDDDEDVLVLPGDAPLLRASTVAALVRHHRESDAAATVLSAPADVGPGTAAGDARLLRGRDDRVVRVVRPHEADAGELDADEASAGIYCFRRSVLAPALRRVVPDALTGELALSDVIEVLADAGYRVGSVPVGDPAEVSGVNDRLQLAAAEAELRRRTNEGWLRAGVTLVDPDRTYLDATVELAPDVTVFPGSILQGRTVVGAHAVIGPDTRLVDCVVGEGAVVEHSVGRDAEVGDGAHVGPFAVLDPGSQVPAGSRVGPAYAAPEGAGDGADPA